MSYFTMIGEGTLPERTGRGSDYKEPIFNEFGRFKGYRFSSMLKQDLL